MEQWPSGLRVGLPNQRSQVKNHKVAEKLPELSSVRGQSMNIKNSWGLCG